MRTARRLRHALVLTLLLALAACRPTLFGRTSGGSASSVWRTYATGDGALSVSYPGTWKIVGTRPQSVAFNAGKGVDVRVALESEGSEAGQSQEQVLAGMLSQAEDAYAKAGRRVEVRGRQAWLGQGYVWHELHYLAMPSDGGKPLYCIDLLAFPPSGGRLTIHFETPTSTPPGDETLKALNRLAKSVRTGAS